jgi:putative endonuclease
MCVYPGFTPWADIYRPVGAFCGIAVGGGIFLFFLLEATYYFFMKAMYVYIMSSKAGVLYVGVTNDIKRRVYEHKNHLVEGFSDKYKIDRLVYVEEKIDATSAIKREKQIKGWIRKKKVNLIESNNPDWEDLGRDWYG